MHLYFDESGNTGVDLLNPDQPIFALASTNLDAEVCCELISPLMRQGQSEAKYTKIKNSRVGQQALIKFFSSTELGPLTTKFMLADKRYYLITHIVDKLIEPPLHEMDHDLYAGDAHVGLVNVWYYAGHTIFPGGHWERIMKAFLQAIRQRTRESFSHFDAVLTAAMPAVPYDSLDFATGLLLARGRLAKFIGVYLDQEVFDPAVDLFIDMVNRWMADTPNQLHVVHDRSKPLSRREGFLRTLMTPVAPRAIGYGNRQATLPLRVSHLAFGDSCSLPQLQVADLVAGASIDCLLAWSGRRQANAFHDAMKETRLEELFHGGMLPSNEIKRENEPGVGEKNLVDGTVDFLKEVGYINGA